MKSNYLSRKTFQLFQNSIDPDYDGHIPISPLCDIRHSSFHGDSPSCCPQTISEYVAVDLSGFLLPCFFLFLSNCFFLSFFPSFFLSSLFLFIFLHFSLFVPVYYFFTRQYVYYLFPLPVCLFVYYTRCFRVFLFPLVFCFLRQFS